MKVEYNFSETDFDEVLKQLNKLLKQLKLVTLARDEIEIANPEKRILGSSNAKYHNIVKVINRWGIRDEKGNYHELLNRIIGQITSRCPLLQIYGPIQFLLFNKLMESEDEKPKFTREEIEIFFLQPYKMIVNCCIPQSALYLNELIIKFQKLSINLKTEDAKEFLNQGLCRRLFMQKTTADNISEIYAEDRIKFLDYE